MDNSVINVSTTLDEIKEEVTESERLYNKFLTIH